MKCIKALFATVISFVIIVISFSLPVVADAGDRALLIQTDLPWGYSTNNTYLSQLVTDGELAGYDTRTFSEASSDSVDFSTYGIIIIAGCQQQMTYNQYDTAMKEKLEAYAAGGGVVVFNVCNNATIATALPGDVTYTQSSSGNNYIVDSDHPIVTGVYSGGAALVDGDLNGNYCSHCYFNVGTLPSGSNVIFRESDVSRPTLVEFDYGDGHVILSGQTWEIAVDYDWLFATKAYDDYFLYGISLAADPHDQPTGLSGNATSNYWANDGIISGTNANMEYRLSTDSVFTNATDTETTGLAAGTYYVRNAISDGYLASAEVTVVISRGPNLEQSAPIGLSGIAPTMYGTSDGKLTGTTVAMEYKPSLESSYVTASASEITGLPAGDYHVRFSAVEGYNAGADALITIPVGPNDNQVAPSGLSTESTSVYWGSDGLIKGTSLLMEYRLSSGLTYSPAVDIQTGGLVAGVYYVRYAAREGFNAGEDLAVTVDHGPAAPQSAPTGLSGTAPTLLNGADGRIAGVSTAMEYRKAADAAYTAVTGSRISGLVAGTYYVRYAASEGYLAGADTTVVVADGENAIIATGEKGSDQYLFALSLLAVGAVLLFEQCKRIRKSHK